MDFNALYEMAEELGITIDDIRLKTQKSFSLMDADLDCFIAIDTLKFTTQAEEKVALAHEIGHCVTGSFYNRYSPYDIRAQHEYRANKQAVLRLIPFDELLQAFENGKTTVYDLAEHFNVTEGFIRLAIEVYTRTGKLMGIA